MESSDALLKYSVAPSCELVQDQLSTRCVARANPLYIALAANAMYELLGVTTKGVATVENFMSGFLWLIALGSMISCQRLSQRVSTLEIRVEKLLLHVGFEADPNPPATDDVALLARTPGAKIAAIKAYRKQTGAGLRESKAAVERMMEKHD